MSFQVNGTELKRVIFNNRNVNEVWYKDGSDKWLVWENPSKFQTETWADLKAICDRVKQGDTWPNYIKLGVVKKLKLLAPFSLMVEQNADFIYVRLIGIDVEGPGTLTFQVIGGGRIIPYHETGHYNEINQAELYYVPMCYVEHEFGATYTESRDRFKWIGSTYREVYCKELYDICEAKPYIKKVKKYTCPYSNRTNEPATVTPVLNEETIWALSHYEVVGAENDESPCNDGPIRECSLISEGVYSQPYTFFSSEEDKYDWWTEGNYEGDWMQRHMQFWTRSHFGSSGFVDAAGNDSRNMFGIVARGDADPVPMPAYDASGFEPCFVIG